MNINKLTFGELPRSKFSPTMRAEEAQGSGDGIRIDMSMYRAEQVAAILNRFDVSQLEQPYRRVYEELLWGLSDALPHVPLLGIDNTQLGVVRRNDGEFARHGLGARATTDYDAARPQQEGMIMRASTEVSLGRSDDE